MNLFTTVLLPTYVCSFFVFLVLFAAELEATNIVKSVLEAAKLAGFVTMGAYGAHLFMGAA